MYEMSQTLRRIIIFSRDSAEQPQLQPRTGIQRDDYFTGISALLISMSLCSWAAERLSLSCLFSLAWISAVLILCVAYHLKQLMRFIAFSPACWSPYPFLLDQFFVRMLSWHYLRYTFSTVRTRSKGAILDALLSNL